MAIQDRHVDREVDQVLRSRQSEVGCDPGRVAVGRSGRTRQASYTRAVARRRRSAACERADTSAQTCLPPRSASQARLPAAVGGLVGYGIGTSVGNVTFPSVVQSQVAERLRGRVLAAFDLIWQAMRLVSLLLGGVLADLLGIRAVFYVGGILLLFAALTGAVTAVGCGEAEHKVARLLTGVQPAATGAPPSRTGAMDGSWDVRLAGEDRAQVIRRRPRRMLRRLRPAGLDTGGASTPAG